MPEEVIEEVAESVGEETVEQPQSKKRAWFYKSPVFKSAVKIILIVTVVVSLLLNLFTLIMPITFADAYGTQHRFAVKEIVTLDKTAVSDMKSGEWDFTLFTCTKGGEQRVTVRCERITD